jgi:hypothetical protein
MSILKLRYILSKTQLKAKASSINEITRVFITPGIVLSKASEEERFHLTVFFLNLSLTITINYEGVREYVPIKEHTPKPIMGIRTTVYS